MNNNENKNNNSLYAWATGDLASIAIGLAVGAFIYKTGVIQKITGKIFSKKEETK
jgi:Ca2+/Na+ antiporter